MTEGTSANDPERLKLVLLPGMDGSGDLFTDFLKFLPAWVTAQVVSYPADRKLSYSQLQRGVESVLPTSEPFVLLAESFSTPLAVNLAATHPKNLKVLIICGGFVSTPAKGITRWIAFLVSPILFRFTAPERLLRKYMLGFTASPELLRKVRSVLSKVSPGVMAHRLRVALACSSRKELSQVSIPLLYISGTDDRLIRRRSIEEIRDAKPDTCFLGIEGPHLIVQTQPRKVAEALGCFLREMRDQHPTA
jgi:pimeloyl-[acyl-carrier protein] methyl ester esterase